MFDFPETGAVDRPDSEPSAHIEVIDARDDLSRIQEPDPPSLRPPLFLPRPLRFRGVPLSVPSVGLPIAAGLAG